MSVKQSRAVSRRNFLKKLIVPVAVLIPTAVYGHYVEIDDLVVERKTIQLDNWPYDASGLKVGFLSDFHCDGDSALERVHRSVAMLNNENPDVVLLGGDYVTKEYTGWSQECINALLPLISAPLGVFCVLGNHDWWSFGHIVIAKQLRQAGFHFLSNSSLPLTKSGSVWVVGLEDYLAGKTSVSAALSNVPQDCAKILLIHEPDYADFAPAGFALQLSGHSHAGQVRVFGHPIITPECGQKYPQGLEFAHFHPVYTTRGVGVMAPRIRIDCKPEVTVLTLISSRSS